MPSHTRRSSDVRARRRIEVRDKLAAIVEDLLDEGATLTEINVEVLAIRAGIARSTFYRYFTDLTQFYEAAHAEIIGDLESVVERCFATDPALMTFETLEESIGNLFTSSGPHAALLAMLYDAAASNSALAEEILIPISRNRSILEQHIVLGQSTGAVDPDLDPRLTALWLIAAVEVGGHRITRRASPLELEMQATACTQLFWNTLYEYAPQRTKVTPAESRLNAHRSYES